MTQLKLVPVIGSMGRSGDVFVAWLPSSSAIPAGSTIEAEVMSSTGTLSAGDYVSPGRYKIAGESVTGDSSTVASLRIGSYEFDLPRGSPGEVEVDLDGGELRVMARAGNGTSSRRTISQAIVVVRRA